MTPETQAELQKHLDAISDILYADSDPAEMQTLEAIEMTVRDKVQEHVSPEVGRFLSTQLAGDKQAESES